MIAKVLTLPGLTPDKARALKGLRTFLPEILFVFLLSIWFFVPMLLHYIDPTSADIDQSHWFLVLLGLITFLLMLALCHWLLKHFWEKAGLPELKIIISKFNYLSSWQQLNFLLASFFLLLLAAVGCLAAIC